MVPDIYRPNVIEQLEKISEDKINPSMASSPVLKALTSYKEAIKSIMDHRKCPLSYDAFYRLTKYICQEGYATDVYGLTHREIDNQIKKIMLELETPSFGEKFPANWIKCLGDLNTSLKMVSDATGSTFCNYKLVDQRVRLERDKLVLLRQLVDKNDQIKNRFQDFIADCFHKYLRGENIDENSLTLLCHVTHDISPQFYSNLIESALLKTVKEYIQNYVDPLLGFDDFKVYLTIVNNTIKLINSFFCRYFVQSKGHTPFGEATNHFFEMCASQEFRKNSFYDLLKSRSYVDMKYVFDSFNRNDRLRCFLEIFRNDAEKYLQYLINNSRNLNYSPKNFHAWLKNVTLVSQDVRILSVQCFRGNDYLSQRLKIFYNKYLNNHPSIHQYLCHFIHVYLMNNRHLNSQDLNDCVFKKFKELIKYLVNRDLFLPYYGDFLKRRILCLEFRPKTEQLTFNYIDKKFSDSSHPDVQKIYKLINNSLPSNSDIPDILLRSSGDRNIGINPNIAKISNTIKRLGFEMEMTIIPNEFCDDETSLILPQFREIWDTLTNVWKLQNPKKTINFCSSLSKIQLMLYIPTETNVKEYELSVSYYQYLVLETVSKGESITFEELYKATQIPLSILLPTVYTLTYGKPKERIIATDSDDSKITSNQRFYLNRNYSSNQTYVELSTMAPLNLRNDPTAASGRLFNDLDVIKSVIMDALKTSKSLCKDQIFETVRQKHSSQQIHDDNIENALSILLQMEFINLSKNNPPLYTYGE